jgi:hypothetical protein
MAPEFPVYLLSFSLHMQDGALFADIEGVERADRARLRVRWNDCEPSPGYRAVAGGAVYVEETDGILFQPSHRAHLDELPNNRYGWIQGTSPEVPWVMIVMVFPAGFTFRNADPRAVSSKYVGDRIAAYWCLRGDDTGRARVAWTLTKLDRSVAEEARLLNGYSSLDEIPTSEAIVLEQPSSGAAQSPLRVFLCHAAEDKPAVRILRTRLLEDGHAPWLDEEDIVPGEDWESAISDAVRSSQLVIVCLSAHSVSKVGFVNKEISRVIDFAEEQPEGSLFLIPVKLDETDVPKRLSRWQALNYYEPNAYQRLQKALMKRRSQLA